MITDQDVRNAIAQAVDNFDPSGMGADEDFFDAGLDSLDHASILLALQENHDLTIPDEAVDDCRSINAILAFAEKNA